MALPRLGTDGIAAGQSCCAEAGRRLLARKSPTADQLDGSRRVLQMQEARLDHQSSSVVAAQAGEMIEAVDVAAGGLVVDTVLDASRGHTDHEIAPDLGSGLNMGWCSAVPGLPLRSGRLNSSRPAMDYRLMDGSPCLLCMELNCR